MKKMQFAAVAAALTCSSGAWAQSSVTVYGSIEAQVGRQTQDAPITKLYDVAGSRLGFTGTEDLGGGMKASFLLEHRLDPDTGASNGGNTFWKGGSYVGLSHSALGEVKLGRWWSGAFLKSQYAADPFGYRTLGAATYGTAGCGPAFRGGCLGTFWVDNSVSYENTIGGFSFGAQISAEAVGTDGKRPANLSASYGAGPLYVALGHEVSNDGDRDSQWSSVALTYDLGVVKLYGGYGKGADAAKVDRQNTVVGFSAPLGGNVSVMGSYNTQKQGGTTVQQLVSLGGKYELSKRTHVFAVVANDSKAPAGTNKSGYSLGVSHSF